jgi:hypothetical protein
MRLAGWAANRASTSVSQALGIGVVEPTVVEEACERGSALEAIVNGLAALAASGDPGPLLA